MPGPNDPVLGLTNTLTALEQPQQAPPPAPSTGEQELAQAARSLESVQGNVAGQTSAIQQMSMLSQQQTTNVGMLMAQLGTQITSLNQAVSQLAAGVGMSAMPQAVEAPGAMPMATGPGMMPRVGSAAVGGLGLMASGMYAGGRFMGGVGAAMASPFFGAPVAGPGPGGVAPMISDDVGFMRAAGMGSMFGIQPQMLRQAGVAQISELGRERMQNRAMDVGLGVVGGAGRLGAMFAGDALGTGLVARGLGIGGLAGGMLGSVAGLPITAAAGLGIDQVMGQVATARGFGEQFSRGAFRYMPDQGLGMNRLRRPGMRQRLELGQELNRMSIDDLTFSAGDLSEMFAGVQQQDLMRGVGSVQEVVRRFRETKDAFKLIGRQMGQGIQEAAETMGALQEMGVDPTGARGRAMVFGASSIMGLSPTEGMRLQTEAGRRFAGQGLGAEMGAFAGVSAQMGQTALQSGALTGRQQAALGGRQGAQQATAQLMEAFMGSELGRAAIFAGEEARGLGAQETIRVAGRRAGSDLQRRVAMQMGGAGMRQEFLSDPFAAQTRMLEMLQSQARVYEQSGLDPRQAMTLALQQTAAQGGLQLTDVQAGAQLDLLMQAPRAGREQMRRQAMIAGDEARNIAIERTSPLARAERAVRRAFTPAAEGLGGAMQSFASRFARGAESIEQAITGRELVDLGRGIDVDAMEGLRARGREAVREEAMETVPMAVPGREGSELARAAAVSRNAQRAKRNKARRDQIKIQDSEPPSWMRSKTMDFARRIQNGQGARVDELKRRLNDPNASDEDKRAALRESMDLLSGGTYEMMNARGNAKQMRAIQDAVAQIMGVNPSAILFGGELAGGASFTAEDRGRLGDLRSDIAAQLGVSQEEAMGFMAPELLDMMREMSASGGVSDATMKRVRDAGLGAQASSLQRVFQDRELDLTAGEYKFDILQRQMSEAMPLQRQQASALRIQAAGGRAGAAVSGLRGTNSRLLGLLPRLGTQNVSETFGAMGRMVQQASDEDIQLLQQSEDPAAQRLARVLSTLGGAFEDEKLDQRERADIVKNLLGGRDPGQDFFDTIKSVDDLGKVATLAMDLPAPGGLGTMPTSVDARAGLTREQAAVFERVGEQMERTARMLDAVEARVRMIEGK